MGAPNGIPTLGELGRRVQNLEECNDEFAEKLTNVRIDVAKLFVRLAILQVLLTALLGVLMRILGKP